MAEKFSSYMSGPLGRLLRGVLKGGLASALIGLLSAIPNPADIQIGNSTIPVSLIFQLLIGFFPVLQLISAMRDMGVGI